MKSLFSFRLFGHAPEAPLESIQKAVSADTAQVAPDLAQGLTAANVTRPASQAAREQWAGRPAPSADGDVEDEPSLLSALGWIAAGVGTLAVGLVLGRELRRRYKFNRRTPYDFYAHSGDERDLEFGVGI